MGLYRHVEEALRNVRPVVIASEELGGLAAYFNRWSACRTTGQRLRFHAGRRALFAQVVNLATVLRSRSAVCASSRDDRAVESVPAVV